MARDGSPFKLHGNGNYSCCYDVYNCGNHVPDWAQGKNKENQQKGIRPCKNAGPCKCFPDPKWRGDGSATCDVLAEAEKKGIKNFVPKQKL